MIARRSGRATPGLEEKLAGDFESLAEVIASQLSDDDKRAILQTWLEDLARQPQDDQTKELRHQVAAALAGLGAG